MELSLDVIFASLDDFELADGISCAIETKYGYETLMGWPEEIPESHKTVGFIWHNVGYALCEGYVAFMWLDCHHAALPIAFRAVGLEDLANIVDLMIEPALESGSLGCLEALESHFGSWERFAAWVAQFEGTLFKASDRIQSAVAAYCRARQAEFATVLPELRATRACQALLAPGQS